MTDDDDRKKNRYHFARHDPEYRDQFQAITTEMVSKCPIAWSDTYGGHWVAAGHHEVFELARSAEYLSNDHDVKGERRGYKGITIPSPDVDFQGGFLEMDPPEQRHYRQALNAYLSPAAVQRWLPVVDELVRASINEKIETGRIDFVDDLANIVPAVLTLPMLGIPLKNWDIYVEPVHASVYTPPDSPNIERVRQSQMAMYQDLFGHYTEIKANPRPGMIDALARAEINGKTPDDMELIGVLALIIGGGFDTTTALTAHALEWLSEHPSERKRLSRERDTLLDSATEEFLRYYTPAPGDGRTISADCEIAGVSFKEGERLWLSWAMSNRDPAVFANPHEIDLARTGNRHHSFGLGIHRCIGSNVARMVFKRMLVAVLDRMPDYVCDPAGAVHKYGTTRETLGWIALNQRANAALNPAAIYRSPLTMDEYLDARMVTTPFGLYDCDVPCDASVAVIVSSVDAVPDVAPPPVYVEAVGTQILERIEWDQSTLTHEPQALGPAAHLWTRTSFAEECALGREYSDSAPLPGG